MNKYFAVGVIAVTALALVGTTIMLAVQPLYGIVQNVHKKPSTGLIDEGRRTTNTVAERGNKDAPIASSGDNIYITWWANKTGTNEVMLRASTDGGKTFGEKINLSNTSAIKQALASLPSNAKTRGATNASISAEGNNVYVVWWDDRVVGPNKTEIFLRASTDNGQTFKDALNLSKNITDLSSGEKVAAQGDNVYVVWSGKQIVNSPSDIFFRRSTDNGQTFNPQFNVSNSTSVDSERAQIGTSGKSVFLTWWETMNGKDQPMLRISTDSGATFGPILKLSANGTITGSGGGGG
jgi:hypothetical protein